MRSIPLIRCLSKMSPSSSTSTGSHIATWRRSLTWTRHDFNHDLRSPSTGKDHRRFSVNPAQRDTLPHRQSQLSDLIIKTSYNDFCEVYITETVTLSPYIRNGPFDQFNFISQCHVTNRSSSSLVKSPSADLHCYSSHATDDRYSVTCTFKVHELPRERRSENCQRVWIWEVFLLRYQSF